MSVFNKTSAYDAILKLKSQLCSSISAQTQSMSDMLDVVDDDVSLSTIPAYDIGFTDSVNNGYFHLSHLANIDEFVVEHQILGGQTISETFTLEEMRDGTSFANKFGFDFTNVIERCNVAEKTNEAFARVNDLFLGNLSVDISVITATVKAFESSSPEVANELLSGLASLTDENNKVQKLPFLAYIRDTCQYGDSVATNEDFELDKTNPYIVISFINILKNVGTVLIQALFTAMQYAFRGILAVVVGLFNAVLSVWTSAKEAFGEVRVKPEQLLWHIAGSVFSGRSQGYRSAGNEDSRVLFRHCEIPGLDVYHWTNRNNSVDTVLYQAYFNLNIHPDRFMKYVYDSCSVTGDTTSTNGNITITNPGFLTGDSETDEHYDELTEAWLTEDEYAILDCDGDFLRRTVAANIIAACLRCLKLGLLIQINNVTNTFPINLNDIEVNYPATIFGAIGGQALSEVIKAYRDYVISGISPYSRVWFSGWSWENITNMHKKCFQTCNNDNAANMLFTTHVRYCRDTTAFAQCDYYMSPVHGLYYTTGQSGNIIEMRGEEDWDILDTYPVSPKVVLPQLNFDAILAQLILMGIVLTVAIFAMRRVTKSLKYRKQIRRAAAAEKVKEKVDVAKATGNKSDIAAATKAMKRFDLESKVFRWGSYDFTNNWWNDTTSSSYASVFPTQSSISRIGKLITVDF